MRTPRDVIKKMATKIKRGDLLRERYAVAFDADWYSEAYPDVVTSGQDALDHFMRHGDEELRSPNPLFASAWYKEQYMKAGAQAGGPFQHYIQHGQQRGFTPNPTVDVDYVKTAYGLADKDDVLAELVHNPKIDRISSWFSRSEYLACNKDVQFHRFPEVHFFKHGCMEGRKTSEFHLAADDGLRAKLTAAPFCEVEHSFLIDGKRVSILNLSIPASLKAEILEQATIDPDVTAFGYKAVSGLARYVGNDIDTRDLIDYRRLLDDVPIHSDVIIILPRLQIGGAEKYAAAIAQAYRDEKKFQVCVLTTDSWRVDDLNALQNPMLNGMRGCHLASLHENLRRTWKPETALSLLLIRCQPKAVFVINSDLGLRCIKQHGRSLAGTTKVYSLMFSESPHALGAPFSARYLRDVIDHSTVISDNHAAIATWKTRVGEVFHDKFLRIAAPTKLPAQEQVKLLIESRLQRRRKKTAPRGLWVGRWEPFKAVDLLCAIAAQSLFQIDVYGTGLPEQSAVPANLRLMGVLGSSNEVPVDRYDFLLFTSQFEGMPNTVLEFAAAGLPIIASDVGGIKETFGDEIIKLVDMKMETSVITAKFVDGITELMAEKDARHAKRCWELRERVELHHNVEDFRRRILALAEESDHDD
jgi:glycosyltransferase involved in cell wall biosynthesis